MRPHLTFVHITDSHLGPDRAFAMHGQNAYRSLERLVGLINDFPQPPDFVVHTGDVSNDRSAESYALAAELLGRLRVPLYVVNGNHDDRALLRKVLGAPGHPSGDPAAPLDYAFEVRGERFVVLDAHDPSAVPDPQGHLRPDQLAWVRAEAVPDGPPLTVLLHFPLFPMGSPWLDANMLVDNGLELHAALLPARGRLRGVFCGHLHSSVQVARDGITYTSAPGGLFQYDWRPWHERPRPDPDFPPGYSLVRYFDGQALATQHTFDRSAHP